MTSQTEKGEKFARSHVEPGIVVLPKRDRSVATSKMPLAALAFVQRAMRELREHGTFSYAPAALSNASTNAIMARQRGS